MTETRIDHYFTPDGVRVAKRQKPSSSPSTIENVNMDHEKVGDLSRTELMGLLMEGMGNLLDDKLSKVATKDDIAVLSSKVMDLEENNRKLTEEVKFLKSQEKFVLSKLVDLESRSRRNNLIFKGLKINDNTRDYRHVIKQFCKEVVGHGDVWVNRAHPLGGDRSAIIAHIPDDTDVQYIMARVKKLKGTGYVIHRDFPREVREKRSRLAAVRAEVERVAGRKRMPLIFDHLVIDGQRFTWEDGKLRCGEEDGGTRLSVMLNHDFGGFLAELPKRQVSSGPRYSAPQLPERTAIKDSGDRTAAVAPTDTNKLQ